MMAIPGIRLRGLLAIALLAGAAGCKDSPLSPAAAARQRWTALSIRTYEYVLTTQCFCAEERTRPVRITVVDGAVTARVYADSAGGAVDPVLADQFPSIDGLFDLIQAAYDRPVASIQVDYEARYGYPVRIAIDNVANAVDDEVTYLVSPFTR